MEINLLKNQMEKLNEQIHFILTESGYFETEDLTEIEWDQQNPDDWMLYYKYLEAISHLQHINQILNYLEKPVIHEGILTYKNDNYKLDGIALYDGQCIEILIKDEYAKKYVWKQCYVKSSADHHSQIKAGVKGRIRE